MSKKLKKKFGTEQVIAGFLKPTVASQRRSCKAPNRLMSPNKTHQSKKKEKKKINSKFGLLNIEKVCSSLNKGDMNGMPSAVEVYSGKFPLKSCLNSEKKCHPELCEAKKMCEELKEQIKDLKLQQSEYQERLKTSFHDDASHSVYIPHLSSSHQKNGSTDENLAPRIPNNSPILTNCYVSTSALPEQQSTSKKNLPFQDLSNVPNQLSYNDLLHNTNDSNSIIKQLHSEKDRYKRRVVKLQQELKQIKKKSNAFVKTPEIPLNELSFYNADMIGEGRLAVVYEGTLNGKHVAVKKLIRSGVMTSSDRSYLTAEANLLLPLQHHNIVALMGVCSSPVEPLIVTEFVNGKTLSDMILKSGGGLDSATLFSVARDTAIGMAYLHSQKPPVLHLNLRPSNVLVDSFLKAKVTDYGFSKIRIDAGVSNCSNLAYLAPELLKFPAQITVKTDVFAFAVLMWEMSTGRDPMAKRTTSQILDMVKNNERLRIRTDLPISIQRLIAICWEPTSSQRPSFKEIIIEFETMILPDDWIGKLKEIGISRTDTSDMCSTNQDTNSLLSSLTPPSQTDQDHCRNEKKVKNSRYHFSSSQIENQQSVSQNRNYERSTSNDRSPTFPHSYPTPINRLRYISHNLENEINTPEIVSHKSRLESGDLPSKPRTSLVGFHSSYLRDKAASYPTRQAWSGEPSSFANSKKESSRFDSKFRDFVSDACQAESTHKAHSTSYGKWLNLPPNPTAQKSKSLQSSENIQVHSVSAASCSVLTSSSNNSSFNTAVHVPGYHRPSNETSKSKVTYVPNTSKPHVNGFDHSRVQLELNKSNSVLSNAKRLLSSSPLHTAHNSLAALQGSPYPAVKTLPEYVPKCPDQRRFPPELGYVPSESSKSDFSAESFLPLPTKLLNHQCLLSLNESPRTQVDGSNQSYEQVVSNSKDRSQASQDFDDGKSDKVSRILTRTAEELSNASCMLLSATEELRKQKLNGSF